VVNIDIGGKHYTQAQIDALNELYGAGFLQANPHFPAAGTYVLPDGAIHWGPPETLEERALKRQAETERQRQIEQEDNAQGLIIMIACAERSGTMGLQDEQIIAYVIGHSRNDCREKFVRQYLKYRGEDWQTEFKKWQSNWHYERYIKDAIT